MSEYQLLKLALHVVAEGFVIVQRYCNRVKEMFTILLKLAVLIYAEQFKLLRYWYTFGMKWITVGIRTY